MWLIYELFTVVLSTQPFAVLCAGLRAGGPARMLDWRAPVWDWESWGTD